MNVYVDGDDPVEVIRHKVGKALGKPAESVRIIFAGRQLPSELAIMWCVGCVILLRTAV